MAITEKQKPEIRYLREIKSVLLDQQSAEKSPDTEVYYMWRGIERKNGLRYDITIIPSRMLGEEFAKTKGHEHSNNFAELYIVLEGNALYLAQKYKNDTIVDVFAVEAKKGQAVIIPQGYGHITINPSSKELKEANWLNEECKNIYDLFVEKQGACYYYTTTGWIKNEHYKNVPLLRFEKPLENIPENLDFLN